ncbi:hypothetical protein QOT17_019771 [Balamuthia mandrillaris]
MGTGRMTWCGCSLLSLGCIAATRMGPGTPTKRKASLQKTAPLCIHFSRLGRCQHMDQRLDLVVCGLAAGPPTFAFSAVFLQTEEGQFRDGTAELFPGGALAQVRACAVRFVDHDGDDLLDLAISGGHASGSNSSGALLRNTGPVFEDVADKEFGNPPPLPLNPPGARMV